MDVDPGGCYRYRVGDQFVPGVGGLRAHRGDRDARQVVCWTVTATLHPAKGTADGAAVYPRVRDEPLPSARQPTERSAAFPTEADHGGQLGIRLRRGGSRDP